MPRAPGWLLVGPQYGRSGTTLGLHEFVPAVLEKFGPRSTQERMEALNVAGVVARSSELLEPGFGLVLTARFTRRAVGKRLVASELTSAPMHIAGGRVRLILNRPGPP